MKPATVHDVARVAGVSSQTVSRVLRGSAQVRPATRERVEAALAELDYRLNEAARSLRTRRVNRIGMLVHAVSDEGPGRTLAGAAEAARRAGYLLDIVPMDAADASSVDAALELLGDHQIAGLIATAQTEEVLDAVRARAGAVPSAVDVTTSPEGFEMSHDEAIGALVADHLLALGHRRVATIAGPSGWISAGRRAEGFAERFRAGGGVIVASAEGDWSGESGERATRALLADAPGITALAIGNDAMALGALAALADAGVRVPEDLSVVGVDDVPAARFHRPGLTTVALDFEGEGRRLVEDLLVRLGGLAASASEPPASPRLVVRSSSGPAPASIR